MNLKRSLVVGLVVLAGLVALPASASAILFTNEDPITFPLPDNYVADTAAADFDGNGNSDIVSVGSPDRIEVMLADNDGEGFHAATGSPIETPAIEMYQVYAGEFGGDSAPDIVAVGFAPNFYRFYTFLGDGTGEFSATPDFTYDAPLDPGPDFGSIYGTGKSAVGDVNHDGFNDIVAPMTAHYFLVALGSASGAFTTAPNSPVNVPTPENYVFDGFTSAAIGDWNGNGDMDVALVLPGGGGDPYSDAGVYQAFGSGDGQFTPDPANPVVQQSTPLSSVATVDLDGDSNDDVAYTAREFSLINPEVNFVRTLTGSDDGLEPNPNPAGNIEFGEHSEPSSLDVADYDNDGEPEIAVALRGNLRVSILDTDGAGGISVAPQSPFNFNPIGGKNFSPNHLSSGDFNGDGALDIAADSTHPSDLNQARGIDVLVSRPEPAIDPVTVDFPNVEVDGSSDPMPVTITNDGVPDLPIEDVELTGTGADQFAFTPGDCGATVPGGEDCDLQVTFEPTLAGHHQASLQIEFPDGVGVGFVTLAGTTSANAVVDPPSHFYGEVTAGYNPAFKTQDFEITSTGGADLELGTPELTGPDPANFAIVVPPGCSDPVEPNDTCTIGVQFAPGADTGGLLEAVLEFPDANTPEPVEVELSGRSRPSEYTVTPASKNFGDALIGSGITRTSQTFTVESTRTDGDVPFNGASITGSGASSFVINSNDCPAVIPFGDKCDIKVTFDPKTGSAGARAASLVIDAFSSTTPGPRSVALTGTATVPPPQKPALSLKLKSPGKVKRGKTLTVTATVKNTGQATARSVQLKTTVPKRLAKKVKAIKISSLAAGKSVTKKIKVKVKKSARKGKKLKVKVVASATGVAKKPATRTAKVG